MNIFFNYFKTELSELTIKLAIETPYILYVALRDAWSNTYISSKTQISKVSSEYGIILDINIT